MTKSDAGRRFTRFAALLALSLAAACDSTGSPLAPMRASASNRSGGNASAAQTCQNGGYLNVSRADGSAFRNAGDCTSYAAQGGGFGPVIKSLSVLSHGCGDAVYLAVFTGGTGAINGQPVQSGVPIDLWVTGVMTLTVTNASGVSVSAVAPVVEFSGSDCI